jgi:molybdopterin/thiamine biosynthesis adenylyltransferase
VVTRPGQPQPSQAGDGLPNVLQLEIPADLREGRRALEDLAGLKILEDWRFDSEAERWYLKVSLQADGVLGSSIPVETHWYAVAEARYPFGRLEIYPSKALGLDTTYQHQSHNTEGASTSPWRRGNICVTNPGSLAVRERQTGEPLAAGSRLRWRLSRAIDWLANASAGTLVVDGDLYELPDFPVTPGSQVVFDETESSWYEWEQSTVRFGSAHVVQVPSRQSIRAIRNFVSFRGDEVRSPHWGSQISVIKEQEVGIWIRLASEPIRDHWHVPETWEELVPVLENTGIDLDQFFKEAYAHLRNGQAPILLLGFPTPRVIGGPPKRMHWAALQLPMLLDHRERKRPPKPNIDCLFWTKKRSITLTGRLRWIRSVNWSTDDLGSRGRLPAFLRDRRTVLIGAGALGSFVAEFLARGGVTSWLVFDGDVFNAGNLVRHTLSLNDIGKGKASALASRLRLVSPHINARGLDQAFTAQSSELDDIAHDELLILDCTADDQVAIELGRRNWKAGTRFISLSLGYEAKQLYFYSQKDHLDAKRLMNELGPHVDADLNEHPAETFPHEGMGCWHPVFPARIDLIAKCAAFAVALLCEQFDSIDSLGRLMVISQ